MPRSTFLTVAMLLVFSSGSFPVFAQSSDSHRFADRYSDRVSVEPQPGAPLRVSSVADRPEDPQLPHVEFVIGNVSAKPIRAYRISYDTLVQGTKVTLGVGADALDKESVLQPGESRTLGIPNRDRQHLTLWVDYVEFTDGTSWGADTAETAAALKAERAGARDETDRLLRVLKAGGTQAVIEDITSSRSPVEVPPGSTPAESNGFRLGVNMKRSLIRRAFERGGVASALFELRRP